MTRTSKSDNRHLHHHLRLLHLLFRQLEKVYNAKNEEDDMMEMEEERLRMREHVMKNVRLDDVI